jgi:hypothetical protein
MPLIEHPKIIVNSVRDTIKRADTQVCPYSKVQGNLELIYIGVNYVHQ